MEQSSLNNMTKLSLNKDVFKQKGGTLGLVLLAGLLVVVAFNAGAILAWIQTVTRMIVAGAALAVILYVLFDPKVRLVVSTWYMLMIRKFLGAVVKMDPISILEDTIKKMYRSIAKLEDSMGKLNGVRLKLADKIDEKKQEFKDCMDRKKAAGKRGNTGQEVIEDKQSVRIKNLTDEYIKLHDSAEKWYGSMSKIAEMAKLTVQDAENEVEAQKEKYAMVKDAHSAFKSAMSVINGDPDELALYNQAWTYTQEDIMAKLGEMDRVINTAGGLMDKIDVEKDVYKIKGEELEKQYDELGIEGLFTKFENPAIKAVPFPVAGITEGEKTLSNSKAKYF